ncbi:MFS transporter [Salinisphaera hydrothermalis]|uniref:MFS transporter n=1 Tax=Salinisphaera hydrothermalis TaxID=563188 RepID=UPI00055B64C1|nr:MFS transporter [Salinisphaera hydrothermalis]
MKTLSTQRFCGTSTFLANGFGTGVWSVEIASAQAKTGASDAVLGLALLVFAVAALGAMQLGGRIAARYPLNYVCTALGLAFALSLAALGFAGGIASLVIGLALLGAVDGALDVAMNARASMIENRMQRPVMSSFHAAWSIGGAAGAGLAGFLTAHGYGPDIIMPAAAAIALPGLLLAIGGHQAPKSTAAENSAGLASAEHRTHTTQLSLLCLIAFLALLTEGALANWSSIYLQSVLTGVSGGFAIGFAAFSIGMSVGRLAGDRVVARFGRRPVGVAGATLAAVGFAIVLTLPTFTTAFICFALIGLGLSNIVPITFGIASRVARSEAVGISRAASAGYAGFVVGPALIGGLAGVVTLPTALTVLILTTALIAMTGVPAYRSRQDSEAGEARSPVR